MFCEPIVGGEREKEGKSSAVSEKSVKDRGALDHLRRCESRSSLRLAAVDGAPGVPREVAVERTTRSPER